MGKVVIRNMKKQDIPAAASIIAVNYSSKYAERAKRELEEEFSKVALKPRYVVAEQSGKVVGLAGWAQSFMDYNFYELFWLDVLPEAQRHGIGAKLVRRQISEARKKKGDDRAQVILMTTRKPSFFRKFGFKTMLRLGKGKHLMALRV